MRNMFGTVVLGIGLVSQGCHSRKADLAGSSTADRVEGTVASAESAAPSVVSPHLAADEPAGKVPAVAGSGAAPGAAATANVRAGEWDDNANYRDYVRWLQ